MLGAPHQGKNGKRSKMPKQSSYLSELFSYLSELSSYLSELSSYLSEQSSYLSELFKIKLYFVVDY